MHGLAVGQPGADQPGQQCLSMGWDGMGWDGMGWDGMGQDGSSCLTPHPFQGDADALEAGCWGPCPASCRRWVLGSGTLREVCPGGVGAERTSPGTGGLLGIAQVLQGCGAAGKSWGGVGDRHCQHLFPFSAGSFPWCRPDLAPGGPDGALRLRMDASGAVNPQHSRHTGVRCWL